MGVEALSNVSELRSAETTSALLAMSALSATNAPRRKCAPTTSVFRTALVRRQRNVLARTFAERANAHSTPRARQTRIAVSRNTVFKEPAILNSAVRLLRSALLARPVAMASVRLRRIAGGHPSAAKTRSASTNSVSSMASAQPATTAPWTKFVEAPSALKAGRVAMTETAVSTRCATEILAFPLA